MHPAAVSTSRIPSFAGLASTLPGRLLLGLGSTALVAAAAHVAIPLPFTPVPFTLQPLAVLGVGLALGPVGGFLTMLAYLAEGALGLPVFTPAGPGGLAQLLGPTGGFLLAYPLAAAVAGGLTRLFVVRMPRFASPTFIAAPRFIAALASCTLAVALLFVSGAAWLKGFAHLSLHAAWIAAVAPFLPGEAIKVLIAAGVYNALAPGTRDREPTPPLSIA